MKLPAIIEVNTSEQARELAVSYQDWASKNQLFWSELFEYREYFEQLGEKFGLTEEFRENGVI